jgi:acetyl-CoA acetyltransferase
MTPFIMWHYHSRQVDLLAGMSPILLWTVIQNTGRIPITTMGGLKARGHPVGAPGVYQIVEAVLQLRGEAGKNQLGKARIGMAQNIGGSGATILTHILQAFQS